MPYFDPQKWRAAFQRPNWYLELFPEFHQLEAAGEKMERDERRRMKDEIYSFVEGELTAGRIVIGQTGINWDAERKPIDAIIIHHTKHRSGVTWRRLSAIQLLRLYAAYYYQPESHEIKIKSQPIFSHHSRADQTQVFYAYHWLVRPDGSVERLLNDNETGWQSGNWEMNCRSVAICLDGNFLDADPPVEMINGIREIFSQQYSKVSKDRIFGHREINLKKECPGNTFLGGWKDKLL